jgi:ACS family hexuronate transporter-like MFS transporter
MGSLAVVRVALGFGEAGNWPAGGKEIARWFPKERRAFAMGVFDSGSAVGAILAPPLVSLLANWCGWRLTFSVLGGLGALWIMAWLVVYADPATHRWLSPAEREAGRGASAARAWPARPAEGIWRDSRLWVLLVARAVVSPVWWFYVFWLPDYFARGHGLSLLEIGLFGWMPFLTVDLGKLAGGAVSDRLIRAGWSVLAARRTLLLVGALTRVGGVGAGVTDAFSWAMGSVCVATFGFGVWGANILALHADTFPEERLGAALGASGAAASLAGAAASFAVGQFLDDYGYANLFLAAGLAPLLALVHVAVAVRAPKVKN